MHGPLATPLLTLGCEQQELTSGFGCSRGGNDAMYCTSRPKGHAHLCRMTPFLFVIDIFVILAAIYAFQVGTKNRHCPVWGGASRRMHPLHGAPV